MILAEWESECVICGASFRMLAPISADEDSARFCLMTCQAHRMTPSEISRLRRTKADQRRNVFEQIKMQKMGCV